MHGSSASRIALVCLLLAAGADVSASTGALTPDLCARNGCDVASASAHRLLGDAIRELLPTRYAAGGRGDLSLAAGLLDEFLTRHGVGRHNTTIGRVPGEYGELIPANQHAALLLGEATKMLGEPVAAAAAFERAAAWVDATKATKLRARRHLVSLYAGPLDNRQAATRVCHALITEHAGAPVTDRLTERWADVEAAQMIVEIWSTQPVDAKLLRRECNAMLTESEDDAVRMVATAGLVRASVAAGQRGGAVRIAAEALRRVPSLVRMVDPGAPWPFRDTPTIRDYERLVNMRHYDPEMRHDEPRLVADMDRVIPVDYTFHPLATLVEATVTATGDYGMALARLRDVREALGPLSTSRRTYIRYLMLTLIEDGPGIVNPGNLAWDPGRDPVRYSDVSPQWRQSSANVALWDPMRRVTLGHRHMQALIRDWHATGGSGFNYERVASPMADGVIRSGLSAQSEAASVLSATTRLVVLREADAIVERGGQAGRWTKVAYGAHERGWVFSGDIAKHDDRALFDPAPSAPAPWPTEASSQGRNACVAGSCASPHAEHVLPYVGDQEAVIVDVTGDSTPDILAAGADGLVALDGATRRLVWLHRGAAGSVPTVSRDVVYVDDTHAGGQFACALDARSGHVLWQTRLCRYATPRTAAPVVVGDHAFFRSDDGLRTLAAASGETVRNRPSGGVGSWIATDGTRVVYPEAAESAGAKFSAVMQVADGSVERSLSTWYGRKVLHGGLTYTPYPGGLSAADPTDGSWIRVLVADAFSRPDCRPVIDGRDVFLLRDVRSDISAEGMTQRLRADRWPAEGRLSADPSDRH